MHSSTVGIDHPTAASRARRLALIGALALSAATPAFAQDGGTNMARAGSAETTSLEIFITQYWFDGGEGAERPEIGGGGARLMTNLGRPGRATNAFFTRSALGGFVVYTAKQDENEVKTLHFGGQIDSHLLPRPLFSFLDPFLSVGVGGFRTSTVVPGGLLSGDEEVSNIDFAVTPGVGTHFHLTPNISIRGDLRDVIIFGEPKMTHNFEASAGLSLNF